MTRVCAEIIIIWIHSVSGFHVFLSAPLAVNVIIVLRFSIPLSFVVRSETFSCNMKSSLEC